MIKKFKYHLNVENLSFIFSFNNIQQHNATIFLWLYDTYIIFFFLSEWCNFNLTLI